MAGRISLIKKPPSVNQRMRGIHETLKRQMAPFANQHVQIREGLVSNWSPENKPTFTKHIDDFPNKIRVRVKMEANSAPGAELSVYELLDEGTDLRYMHVSDDWQSKTTPGSLKSGAGTGTTVGLGKPVDGIDERRFESTIDRTLNTKLDTVVYNSFKEGLDRVFE